MPTFPYDGADYVDMWMRRCSQCSVCHSDPSYAIDRHGVRTLRCDHHRYRRYSKRDPIVIHGDSIQQVISQWNTLAGSGWTLNGIISSRKDR